MCENEFHQCQSLHLFLSEKIDSRLDAKQSRRKKSEVRSEWQKSIMERISPNDLMMMAISSFIFSPLQHFFYVFIVFTNLPHHFSHILGLELASSNFILIFSKFDNVSAQLNQIICCYERFAPEIYFLLSISLFLSRISSVKTQINVRWCLSPRYLPFSLLTNCACENVIFPRVFIFFCAIGNNFVNNSVRNEQRKEHHQFYPIWQFFSRFILWLNVYFKLIKNKNSIPCFINSTYNYPPI